MNNSNMPAMPQNGVIDTDGNFNDCKDMGGVGLTKREHFASMAMQGLLANSKLPEITAYVTSNFNVSAEQAASMMAIENADALLAELEK